MEKKTKKAQRAEDVVVAEPTERPPDELTEGNAKYVLLGILTGSASIGATCQVQCSDADPGRWEPPVLLDEAMIKKILAPGAANKIRLEMEV